MFQKIVRYLRLNEWYDSKVPFVLCYIWSCYLRNSSSITTERYAEVFIAGAVFTSLFLAFGYMINDYADREVDAAAGKDKLMYHMTEEKIMLSFVVVVLLGSIPVLLISHFSVSVLVMTVLTYLVGASYSMPPFRFKEKGVAGLVISAFAQRCMPIFVIMQLLPADSIVVFTFTIASFIIGLRYIFIHQVIDIENDLKGGVTTFATSHFKQAISGVYVSFLFEILLILAILFLIDIPFVWFAALLSIIPEWTQCRMVTRFMGKKVITTFCNVPLEGYENIILPIVLGTSCFFRISAGKMTKLGRIEPIAVLAVLQVIFLLIPAFKKLSLTVGYIKESGRAYISDRKGALIDLFQDLFMCISISIVIARLNNRMDDIQDIILSTFLSLLINYAAGFLFEISHFGMKFANLFPLKKGGFLWKFVRNLMVVMAYVSIIGTSMYLIKVPNPGEAMRLFSLHLPILCLVGMIVSLLVEPLSVRAACVICGDD